MNGYNLVRLQPQQVLKAGDTMTGNLTMSGGAKFVGDLTGNADTSTRLANPRTINGMAFNGTQDIVTTFWGNARNMYISDADGTNTGVAVSVDGSNNVTLKLPTTIKSNLNGSATSAAQLQNSRNINGRAFNGTQDITTVFWGEARDISVSDSDGTNTGAAVSVNGANNATLKLPATIKGSLTGNATTATTLQAPKKINGTDFDGSQEITTDKWGTIRNITIGKTTKPVDGSTNMGWDLVEIGANPGVVPNTMVLRDVNSDISVRLLKSSYNDETTITGALAFRVNNSTNSYLRFCSNPAAIRDWMKLGSVLATAPGVSNLNSALNSGWYSIDTNTNGKPAGVIYGVVLHMRWHDDKDFYQILIDSKNTKLFVRGYVNGQYSGWLEK